MLFAYARDTDAVVTVHGSDTTPAIETDARWFSGQPSEVTVVSGVGASSPSTGHYVDYRIAWTNPRAVGFISALRLSVPAGVLCAVTGKRPADGGYTYALGGNAASERTKALPDGRVQLLVEPAAGNDDLIGVQIRMFNDENGQPWADDETDASIGELGCWSVAELVSTRRGWKRGRSSAKRVEFGEDAGVAIYSAPARRDYTLSIDASVDEIYLKGLPADLDIETLEALLHGSDARCMCIPRRYDPSGAFDSDLIHRTAIFGVAEFADVGHVAGPEFLVGSLKVFEVL